MPDLRFLGTRAAGDVWALGPLWRALALWRALDLKDLQTGNDWKGTGSANAMLAGKWALVCGANKGLGLAGPGLCAGLVREG